METKFNVGKHIVGGDSPCFTIAEIGINHGGDVEVARRLIKEAANAGASSVKFQTYITDKRVKKDNPVYGILKQCELGFDQQRELKEYAEEGFGVPFFSTPFDDESVDFLESIDVEIYKIASFDSVNKSLLRKVAKTGKPVIMSTGMSSRAELDAALEILGNAPLALLHCVSAYPTPHYAASLRSIHTLRAIFTGPVGYSDHTIGGDVASFAVAAGAQIVEKHFTLDCKAEGPDHALSADPGIFKDMVRRIREVEKLLGSGELRQRDVEASAAIFRRPSA